MHNDMFASNTVSPYYLYTVKTDTEVVTGILFKLNVTKENLEHLIPHEDIDILKVSRISKALLSDELAKLPIVVGLMDDEFSNILEQFAPSDLNIGVNNCDSEDIIRVIAKVKELILIDGHHRCAAAREALEFGEKIHLWCWFVPFDKLKLHSFIKIFTKHSHIDINNLIHDKYTVSTVAPENNNQFEITLYVYGHYYQLLSKSEDDFLHEMNILKDKLEQSKLILVEKHEILPNNNYITTSNADGYLSLKHAQITHEMVLNTIKRGQVLPLHSTCFKPKPEYIQMNIRLNEKYRTIGKLNSRCYYVD